MVGEHKRIVCYVSLAGNNKISDWYEGLSAQARADADEFIKNMRRTSDWKMPSYRPSLKGHTGLGELRWQSADKQHRLVGFLKGGVFFALIGCTHKQRVYTPHNALETADRRKAQIERSEVRTVDYDL